MPGWVYRSAEDNKAKTSEAVGIIPIDSMFSPVRRVSYRVENTQVGQMTNYERLILDVETNGSIRPAQAVSSVGKTLGELVGLFAGVGEGMGLELGDFPVPETGSDDLHLPIEALELSERPRNCLRAVGNRHGGRSGEVHLGPTARYHQLRTAESGRGSGATGRDGLSLSDQEASNAASS